MAAMAFFSGEDVIAAKEELCEVMKEVCVDVDITNELPKRNNSTLRTAREASIEDILSIMQKLDANGSGTRLSYLVEDVSQVPASSPESGTLMCLTEELAGCRREILQMQQAIASMRSDMLHQHSIARSHDAAIQDLIEQSERDRWEPYQQPQQQRYEECFLTIDSEQTARKETQLDPMVRTKQPNKNHSGSAPELGTDASRPAKATMADMAANLATDEEGFTEVKKDRKNADEKKKRRRQRARGTAEGAEGLQSGPKSFKVVLTYVNPDTTTETLRQYIAAKGVQPLDVEDKSSPDWDTKRFIVKLGNTAYEKVMDPSFWPQRIVFDRWFDSRKSSTAKQNGGAKD